MRRAAAGRSEWYNSVMTNSSPSPLATFEDHESSVRSYSRHFPVVLKRAKGAIMTTVDGTEYIDFFAGAGGLNYGHNDPDMQTAMIDYIKSDGVIHGLDMATEAKEELLKSFVKYILEPRGMVDYKLQFVGPTGTNAVEAALKIARNNTKRSEVIALKNGFHGVSLGSLAATANPYFRDAAGVPLQHINFVTNDDVSKSVEDSIRDLTSDIEASIAEHGLPAAVIAEVTQGEGGVNTMRPEWLQALRAITEDKGMLLIIDDIQAGCGRSGTFFSFEPAGIMPDIITLSKSLSGSGLPMSLVLVKSKYDTWKPGEHSGTFRGNNLAFVTSRVAIEKFWKDDTFAKDVQRKAAHISERLAAIAARFPEQISATKGTGFLQGLTFVDPTVAAQVAKTAFSHGLIIERAGPDDEVLKLMPPLTIDDATLDKGIDRIQQSIEEVVG